MANLYMRSNKLILLVICFVLLVFSSEVFGQNSSFDIMSFNIRYDNPADGEHSWDSRKGNMDALVNYFSPDILCMQEALKHQLEFVKGVCSQYDVVGVGRDDGKDEGEFAPIFYDNTRYKLIDSDTFWLSETPQKEGSIGWDAACIRICTWVKLFDYENGSLLFIFNTHLDHVGEVARKEGVKLIVSKISSLVENQDFVLTGDFNMEEGSEEYREVFSNKDVSLLDSFSNNNKQCIGVTNTFNGFQSDIEKRRIDYVFIKDTFKVSKYANLSLMFDGWYCSDHHPVLVEIVKPGNK